MDPFLTIYKKDYVRKYAKRPDPVGTTSEYPDPVGEAFKKYLQLSSAKEPPVPPIESADDYQEKHVEKHPKHGKMYFPEPVDNAVIQKSFIYNGRSEYQVDYCDLQKDEEYKEVVRQRNLFRLPNDWDIPLTTQKYSYRNPSVINSRAYERTAMPRVPNNLDPSEKIRKILKVTTGVTDYGGIIGDLGGYITERQLHGTILPPKCTCSEHNLKPE